MDQAFSLLNQINIQAESVEYRQNLDDQLVCPECFEQVFKKQIWVPSQGATTHFFSHYAGRFDACSLRTSNENLELSKSDSEARLQKLTAFNQQFRIEILRGFKKIIGKNLTSSLKDTLNFAERIAIEKINCGEIKKISQMLLSSLSEPITNTIDESLTELEEALCPLYMHLTTRYGENNLYFITTVTLLLAYHKESHYLEKLLDKNFIKRTSNLDKILLGNSILLLSQYINWNKSLNKVNNFINALNVSVKTEQKTPNRNILNAKLKISKAKDEHIKNCSICKNPFLSKGDKDCSYCKWKAREDTFKPTQDPLIAKRNSLLSSLPWDEENLKLHRAQNKITASQNSPISVNSSKEIDNHRKTKKWLKTDHGLQNKFTGEKVSFVDTLRDVFPEQGYSVTRGKFKFIPDTDIE